MDHKQRQQVIQDAKEVCRILPHASDDDRTLKLMEKYIYMSDTMAARFVHAAQCSDGQCKEAICKERMQYDWAQQQGQKL